MSLSDLAALGSFVSGIAVIVTLGFLVAQMRQTNRNQRALMQQGRAAQQVDLLLRCADEKLSAVRLKSTAGDLTMTDQEIDTAMYVWLAIWRSLEDGFLQHARGTLDEESFQSVRPSCVFSSCIHRCARRGGWLATDTRPRSANMRTDSCAKLKRRSRRTRRKCGEAWSRKSSGRRDDGQRARLMRLTTSSSISSLFIRARFTASSLIATKPTASAPTAKAPNANAPKARAGRADGRIESS